MSTLMDLFYFRYEWEILAQDPGFVDLEQL